MLFAILTLFPEAVEPYLRAGMLRVAREKGLADFRLYDFRDFTRDRHRTVDDRPFGGGPGMVLKPEPIAECIEWLEREHGTFHKVWLCPTGTRFTQSSARALAARERILLLCGRYEGIDERLRALFDWEAISLGDFVLSGGELPALAVVEAVTRLLPGVLGDAESAERESFGPDSADGAFAAPGSHGQLDHPQYTRPRSFRGSEVPPVLLSGDHRAIEDWRARAARERDATRRADAGGATVQEHGRDPEPTNNTRKGRACEALGTQPWT